MKRAGRVKQNKNEGIDIVRFTRGLMQHAKKNIAQSGTRNKDVEQKAYLEGWNESLAENLNLAIHVGDIVKQEMREEAKQYFTPMIDDIYKKSKEKTKDLRQQLELSRTKLNKMYQEIPKQANLYTQYTIIGPKGSDLHTADYVNEIYTVVDKIYEPLPRSHPGMLANLVVGQFIPVKIKTQKNTEIIVPIRQNWEHPRQATTERIKQQQCMSFQ